MPNIKEVIDENKIWGILRETEKNYSEKVIEKILKKALKKKGLSLKEVGSLLHTENPKLIKRMFTTSGRIKNEIYGERLVFPNGANNQLLLNLTPFSLRLSLKFFL